MRHAGTQEIETPRLLLRRLMPSDAPMMYANWANDPEVTRWLRWTPHKDVAETQELLSAWALLYPNEDYYQWAIVLKDGPDEPIGSIGPVNVIDPRIGMAHIGYCIGKAWWHQGITAEALKTVMDFLFDEVGVNKIESRHDPRNPNSGAVMRKCGMQYEGTLRQSDWNNQGICDASYYGLLASER